MPAENALYIILEEKIKQGALVLPTLPKVALKVREAVDDPNVNLAHLGNIIEHDPALSLGMVKVANSALLGRTVKVESVSQAVTRIGLSQIKSIVTAMALKQIFVSKNDIVAMYMDRSWNKTIDIASVAISLMSMYLEKNKHTSLSLDTMTLAALVHNVGTLPILTEAEQHPDIFANPKFLQQAIAKLSGKVGGKVTREWGFSEELISVAESWSDLTVLPEDIHYLDFIRAGSIYHNVFKSQLTQDSLLAAYVKKGILSDVNFMDTDNFKARCTDVKSMFL